MTEDLIFPKAYVSASSLEEDKKTSQKVTVDKKSLLRLANLVTGITIVKYHGHVHRTVQSKGNYFTGAPLFLVFFSSPPFGFTRASGSMLPSGRRRR
jgi:hypothetical protein